MRESPEIEKKSRHIGVLLFENFSNHCLANAVEPLRVCNDLLGYEAYGWQYLTLNGMSVVSSSGLPVAAEAALSDAKAGDVLFLLPSFGFRDLTTPATVRALRVAATRFQVMAGLDVGSWLLASAGLLEGRRATIHWEELDGFAERYPDVTVERQRFIRDANRWTCAGATTALDMVLAMIRDDHGSIVALEVAGSLMHGTAGSDAPQPEFGAGVGDARVTKAISIMRDNLEEPLPLPQLAKEIGIGLHALKLAFDRELQESPGQVYRHMRLSAARRLVEQTQLSVAEVAVRCGYENPAAMTRAFRRAFGQPPRALRRGEVVARRMRPKPETDLTRVVARMSGGLKQGWPDQTS